MLKKINFRPVETKGAFFEKKPTQNISPKVSLGKNSIAAKWEGVGTRNAAKDRVRGSMPKVKKI